VEVRWSVAPFLAVKTRFFCDLPKCGQFYAAPEAPSHGQIHRNKGSWQALPDFDQKIILSMLEANRWSPQTNGERANSLKTSLYSSRMSSVISQTKSFFSAHL